MSPSHPFFVMLRSRRAYFRQQSFALYLRYAHVLGVLLALFGVALVERPALLAEPILHFWRGPASMAANAGWAGAWLACIAVWTRIHRDFIGGGALAAFTRSLPQAVRAAPLVDAVMLLVGLQLFLVPAGLAAWTVSVEGAGGAGDGEAGWFPLRAALLAVLSLGAARCALGGAGRPTVAALAAGFLVLASSGHYGAIEPLPLALATLVVAALVLRQMAMAPVPAPAPAHVAGRTAGAVRLSGMAFLVAMQAGVLARRHPHAALPRFVLAVGVQIACLWMVFGAGKLAESDAFVKVGCWLTVAIMSGFHYLFWNTRHPQQAFLRSLPYGLLRVALAEHALVLGATLLVFGGAWAACLLQPVEGPTVGAQLLRHGAASLLPLVLLGAPVIQRHHDGILLKIVVLVATFLLL